MQPAQTASHAAQATRVAIAATIANTLCMTAAISATIGVFLVPIATEFGWPRAAVSGVLGLISVISAISYPLIGRAMDRFGARWLLLAGNLGLATGILLVSQASGSMLDFYWRFAVVGVFGTMSATGMVSKVVSNWFDARRGLMLGVTAGVGNGVGATIMPIVAGILLTLYGWRTAYLAIGLLVLIAAPFIALWLRNAPESTQGQTLAQVQLEGLSLGEAVRTKAFWLMLVAVAAGAGGMTAMFTHVVPILTGHGVSLAEATGVVATFALVTAAWQVVTGGLLDRFRTPRLILPMYASAMVGMVMLQFLTGSAALITAGVLLGIGMGAEYGALSYFVSRYFGLRHFGAIVGAFYSVVAFIQGSAPALMDVSFDRSGSYVTATLTIVGALGLGMVLLAMLPHPDRMTRGPQDSAAPAPGSLALAA